MRKLMWFTLGFAAACAVGAYLLSGNLLIVISLAVLTATGAVWLICRHFDWKLAPVDVLQALRF